MKMEKLGFEFVARSTYREMMKSFMELSNLSRARHLFMLKGNAITHRCLLKGPTWAKDM